MRQDSLANRFACVLNCEGGGIDMNDYHLEFRNHDESQFGVEACHGRSVRDTACPKKFLFAADGGAAAGVRPLWGGLYHWSGLPALQSMSLLCVTIAHDLTA